MKEKKEVLTKDHMIWGRTSKGCVAPMQLKAKIIDQKIVEMLEQCKIMQKKSHNKDEFNNWETVMKEIEEKIESSPVLSNDYYFRPITVGEWEEYVRTKISNEQLVRNHLVKVEGSLFIEEDETFKGTLFVDCLAREITRQSKVGLYDETIEMQRKLESTQEEINARKRVELLKKKKDKIEGLYPALLEAGSKLKDTDLGKSQDLLG